MSSYEVALPSRRSTKQLARALAVSVERGDLVIVSGPLGAGKTFLVRAALRELGVPEEEPVASPTFALVHEYDTRVPLLHADLYRLDGPAELGPLGLAEEREKGATLFVEWGEPYEADLGGDALTLAIAIERRAERTVRDARRPQRQGSANDRPARRATLSASGPRAEALLDRMRRALVT